MNPHKINLPEELLTRIDSLFVTDEKQVADGADILSAPDFYLREDLRLLLPDLPEFAEFELTNPEKRQESERKLAKLRDLLGKLAFRKVTLSGDFRREIYTKSLEINDMAMVQLHATKRAYLGSVAVNRDSYTLEPGSAAYRLSETYWSDRHGDTRLNVTVLSPANKLLINSRSISPALSQNESSREDEVRQIRNLDHALRTFGF